MSDHRGGIGWRSYIGNHRQRQIFVLCGELASLPLLLSFLYLLLSEFHEFVEKKPRARTPFLLGNVSQPDDEGRTMKQIERTSSITSSSQSGIRPMSSVSAVQGNNKKRERKRLYLTYETLQPPLFNGQHMLRHGHHVFSSRRLPNSGDDG